MWVTARYQIPSLESIVTGAGPAEPCIRKKSIWKTGNKYLMVGEASQGPGIAFVRGVGILTSWRCSGQEGLKTRESSVRLASGLVSSPIKSSIGRYEREGGHRAVSTTVLNDA